MKQGCLAWEGYRDSVQVKQARAQMELNLVRNVKGNKKCFCKHIGDKRKTKENVGPLLSKSGDMPYTRQGKD